MKYKGERNIKGVPLIKLLSKEDLRKLNSIYGTTYQPVNRSTIRVIELVNLNDDIDRLMRTKPERADMEYSEILKAIRDYSEFVEASSQKFNTDIISGSMDTSTDFEEVICNYVDALNEIKRIRNRNKRWCLVYASLGYEEYVIAETLRVSQPAVSKNIKGLKRFFSKVVVKNVSSSV